MVNDKELFDLDGLLEEVEVHTAMSEEDRRSHERITLSAPLFCTLHYKQKEIPCLIANISLGGFCIECSPTFYPEEAEPREPVRLTIEQPTGELALEASYNLHVAWSYKRHLGLESADAIAPSAAHLRMALTEAKFLPRTILDLDEVQ